MFGKLYARTHLRADRWYKLGRALLYGRLEDEKPFSTVRRLVQQEDYALSLMQRAGLPSPQPYGFVELTPEREYLLVTEFFDGAMSSATPKSTTRVIDEGLAIVRKLWDAGLAHRDIKPANLLVRDGKLFLIDVSFAEIHPSPWRQAVDLANMMLCLALRSSPEQVYQRALRPVQRRRDHRGVRRGPRARAALPAAPDDARARPRPACRVRPAAARPAPPDRRPALECPPNRPVGGDRAHPCRGRRGLDPAARLPEGHPDPARRPRPGLRGSGVAVAGGAVGPVGVAGAVHTVTASRLDGGRGGRQRRPVGGHPRTTIGPAPARSCCAWPLPATPAGAVQATSSEPGVRRYQRAGPGTGEFRATWYDLFPGGCLTYQLHSTSDAEGSFTADLPALIGFATRDALRQALRQRSDGRLRLDPWPPVIPSPQAISGRQLAR